MYSPELQSKISEWQAKAASGTITLDEMKQAIIYLRQGRKSAVEAAGKAKSPKSSSKPDGNALLGELGIL